MRKNTSVIFKDAYGGISEMSAMETPLLVRTISTIPHVSPEGHPVSNQAMAAVKGPLEV